MIRSSNNNVVFHLCVDKSRSERRRNIREKGDKERAEKILLREKEKTRTGTWYDFDCIRKPSAIL